jgi:hypothetical protein
MLYWRDNEAIHEFARGSTVKVLIIIIFLDKNNWYHKSAPISVLSWQNHIDWLSLPEFNFLSGFVTLYFFSDLSLLSALLLID